MLVVADALSMAFPDGPIAAGTRFAELTARQRRLLAELPRLFEQEAPGAALLPYIVEPYNIAADAGGLRACMDR